MRTLGLGLVAVVVAATTAMSSIYTETMQLGLAESVLVDCPGDSLATYYYQPHERFAPPDRSNVVIYCGPETMVGPIYVEGEPHWYLQPISPLAAGRVANGDVFLPLIEGD